MITDLVSILVPCYNHEQYILMSLESIKNSNYPLKELIFIDDGSKDNSFEIAKEYLDKNRDIFYNIFYMKQENQGVTKTLNKMIKISQGEYITLLASDDYLSENGISCRVKYLKNNTEKKAVIGIASAIDAKNKIINENAGKALYRANTKLLLSNYINKELTLRWSVVGPTLLLKRSVYDEIGCYNETLRVEDREFYLRMIEKNYLGYIDKQVAFYRIHSTNTSRTKTMGERAGLLEEICNVHLALANRFNNEESIFLKSYSIDKYFINKKQFKLLLLFKTMRALFVELYLLVFSLGVKNE